MTVPSSMSDSRRSVAPLIAFARAWKEGACPTVEDYLAQNHPNGVGVDELLDLVQQEIVSREARGEVPGVEDYRKRFAAHADHIGALFEVNALFATGLGDAPAGPDLADYEVEGRLAAGGMGEVYGARDAALGRRVAVKILRPEWQADAASVARFWGEARTTARLQHPGIVPVYEAGLDAHDRPFIAMKLVEGRTLAALLADRPDPAHDLADFITTFEHVCQTLAYAHTQGVIHRDLKPANVMVGGFGEVQVMDWGLAKGLGDPMRPADPSKPAVVPGTVGTTVPHGGLTVAGEMIGTPGYMPPEQARGDHARVGPASDVFGLGAILCEILTGRPPFDTVAQAQAADLAPARDRLAWVAGEAELVQIALACLAPDPIDRPADAGAVCTALAAYRTGLRERVRAAEHAAVRAVAERKARRRAEVLRLAAIGLLVLAGLGAWGWYGHQADLARDVEAALDDARAAREASIRAGGDPAQAAHAEKAVHRAEGLMRGLTGRADLEERCAGLREELRRDAADPNMIRQLEEIRLSWDPAERHPEGPGPTARYTAAFLAYGIDVPTLTAEEAARRINARPVRAQLIAALDYWGLECLRTETPDPAARRALAVTRAADPDPWRNKFRDAVERHDLTALRRMAKEAESLDLPVPVLVVLGTAVADRKIENKPLPGAAKLNVTLHLESHPDGLTLLREARRRAPADFWANYQLAQALARTPRPTAEAARCYAAAAALRPDLPLVRGKMATILRDLGEVPAALAAYRDEVTARPDDGEARGWLAAYLRKLGELPEAVAEYRTSLRLKPGVFSRRSDLLEALIDVGDRAEAVAEARAWFAAEWDDPKVRAQLHKALMAAGLYAEALVEARRPAKANDLWAASNLRDAEQLAGRAARVAAAADPAGLPVAPDGVWEYVRVCARTGHDAAAVRYTGAALAFGKPPVGADLLAGIGAAVRLGTGPAGDGLSPAERAKYRLTALDWLKTALAYRDPSRLNSPAFRRMAVREFVRSWDFHHDLAAVRDAKALDRLSGLERAGWRKLWADVAARVRALDRGEDDVAGPSPVTVPPVRILSPVNRVRPLGK